MLHQHSVQVTARATARSQARQPRISRSFLAHSGDVRHQRRELARAQGALSRAERRFLSRAPYSTMVGSRGPSPASERRRQGLCDYRASSVSRALAKQNLSQSPLCRPARGLCRLRVVMDECG